MSLSPGTRLGAYEILSALGAGGMGEVYKGRDPKLGRDVAIKVLPEALALDPERVGRFEREAKALAALNHPRIAALYGLEQSASRPFLVMELVEGETLAERIARGPLRVDEAIRLALQIAEGLEAAHEKGIVHRDLKPANAKITPDDTVKVLDFGLAKAMETGNSAGSTAGPSMSPTLSMMATQAGVVLGTAAYMSPEQAKGLPADQRSDVFSFGVVVYEMLTGRQPFRGETAPEVLASVMIRDADLTTLPSSVPPRLRELIRRCLQKNPKQRWQHIGDARSELESILTDPVVAAPSEMAAPRPLWSRALPSVASAVVVGTVAAAAAWMVKPTPPAPKTPVARFTVPLGENQQFTNAGRQVLAISPDGTHIVYVANQRLFLRSIGDLEARAIPGTDSQTGVAYPVFAPDGQSIAFHNLADRTIKRIALTGGAAVTVCQADLGMFGLTWSADRLIFSLTGKGVMRVSSNGGTPELIATTKDTEQAQGGELLPDGRTLLFTLAASTAVNDRWEKANIVVQSLTTGERKTVIQSGSDARYLPTGHIVYALGGVLFAVPFDLRRLQVTGGPVPVLEGVRRSGGTGTGSAQFALSATGTLVFVAGPASTSTTQYDLALFDRRTGAPQRLKLPPGPYETPRIAPDGKQVAFGSDDGKDATIWIYALDGTRAMSRLTFGGRNRFPIWSADGQHVAFQSDREGDLAVYWQRADGTGTAERLTKPEKDTVHTPDSWAASGDRFLFDVTSGGTTSLWAFSMKDHTATRFDDVQSRVLTGAVFSSDARWVAYSVRDVKDGVTTVTYVQPFPPTGAKYQVSSSAEDGHHPLWSTDGTELFFVPGPGRFVVESIATKPTFTFGTATPVPRQFGLNSSVVVRTYDLSPDGREFVGVVDPGLSMGGSTVSATQIQVVLNWLEELKARVPTK